MYLTRVEIDFNNRKNAKELNHLGAYHNWVEESFPQEVDKKIRTRKLWRIDTLNNKEYLLIVSEDKPDLNKLERYGVKGSAKTKDYGKFLETLEEGQKYKFRLVANTTVSKPVEGKRGRVVPIVDVTKQMDFLLARAEKNGFELNPSDFYVLDSSFLPLKKHNEKTINLIKVTYQGELTIKNKEKFLSLLTKGIGRKKAYGFGMMTVIPIK
ncbi:type I-E CRISPR-associated protein Cas6/Cse3/CasE [Peptoniphilus sp.]|jgi:CRISPR system Cascade subunit CasE|uniref:type I-E CRISPR-associated protein Cas6/Cse3/CasE n=1 Tax=Peptoniphilus sp. TaxID=1971214 RepID=UPI003D8B6F2A